MGQLVGSHAEGSMTLHSYPCLQAGGISSLGWVAYRLVPLEWPAPSSESEDVFYNE